MNYDHLSSSTQPVTIFTAWTKPANILHCMVNQSDLLCPFMAPLDNVDDLRQFVARVYLPAMVRYRNDMLPYRSIPHVRAHT